MRVTLTLDHDVAEAIERVARVQSRTTEEVLSQALRSGLGLGVRPPEPATFRVEPHSFGLRPEIDLDRINQLVDDLEVDERTGDLQS